MTSPGAGDREGRSFDVTFLPSGKTARVMPGATVMDAAALAGVWVYAPCGGEGTCGKCAVRLEGEAGPPTTEELDHLSAGELEGGMRLACQAVVSGPCEVELSGEAGGAAVKAGLAGAAGLEVDLPSIRGKSFIAPPLGAAIDVGTTTLCVSCFDLRKGERLGIATIENPQTIYGADVMTRIDRCTREPGAAGSMQEAVVKAVDALVADAASSGGEPPSGIVRLVAVGNTTMMNLLLGKNPAPLGSYPFEPPVLGPVEVRPADIGLSASSGAKLLVPPMLSGFLGADIVAVMLATGLVRDGGVALAVDLGTNGEIALSAGGRIAACSTAAGPAFEGMNISSGMRAMPGAVEAMSRDGRLVPRVMGGGAALGICGSGLMDTVAALLEAGLLMPSGRLAPPAEADETAPKRIRDSANTRKFIVDPGSGVALTQDDVRQFQLAKGAVATGIDLLCSTLAVDAASIEKVYLAGVFGSFLRPTSAVAVGLLPATLNDRIDYSGNAALTGAEMLLLSERMWDEARALAGRVDVVELSLEPSFQQAFVENLSFPAL